MSEKTLALVDKLSPSQREYLLQVIRSGWKAGDRFPQPVSLIHELPYELLETIFIFVIAPCPDEQGRPQISGPLEYVFGLCRVCTSRDKNVSRAMHTGTGVVPPVTESDAQRPHPQDRRLGAYNRDDEHDGG